MNVNYVYPEYYYPAYPEYYYGYYEPVKPRNARRSYCPITGAASVNLPQNAISNHSDIDESVKQLIQMSKEQIAKEKEINETKLCGSSNNSAVNVSCSYNNGPCNLNPPISHNETHKSSKNSQSSPVIGETNRLAKHIVEILENIYQTSSFVNRKRREEIAQDLNLPVEKVRNWFQNRRGKDRRQNQVQRINSRKYVRSGKYARKTNDDFVYYDQKISSDSGSMIMDEGCRGAGGGSIVLKTAGVCDLVPESASVVAGINFLAKATEVIACSPEKVKVGKLAYTVESGPNSPGLCSAPTMPYWPPVSTLQCWSSPALLTSSTTDDSDWCLLPGTQYDERCSVSTAADSSAFGYGESKPSTEPDYEVVVDNSTNKSYIVLNDTALIDLII